MVRGHRASGEAQRCTKESAALVEHELLDQLVGSDQDRLRDRQAQRLGGLEIDDQLENAWLFDRKFGCLRSPEDSIHVVGGSMVLSGKARSAAHHPASRRMFPLRKHGGLFVPQGEL